MVYSRSLKVPQQLQSLEPGQAPSDCDDVPSNGDVGEDGIPSSKNSGGDGALSGRYVIDDLDLPIALQKGLRSCTKYPISNYMAYSKLSIQFVAFTTTVDSVEIPRNIYEALKEPKWKVAVLEEMRAPYANGTWEIVDMPENQKVVGSKWVFTVKYEADGSIERYKARLVA